MPSKSPSRRATTQSESVEMDLYEQPGHLIRRAHQIANGMFKDLVGADVTTVQYAILRMIHERPGIDQVSLARHIALDTSTTALTAARLESKGLLQREVMESNRRMLCLNLTPEGEATLANMVPGVHRMRGALLSALEPSERLTFMRLLRKFVHVNNEQSPAPLQREAPARPAAAPKSVAAPRKAAAKKAR